MKRKYSSDELYSTIEKKLKEIYPHLDKLYNEYKSIPKRFRPVEIFKESLEEMFDEIRR